jgi:hypothetical protein
MDEPRTHLVLRELVQLVHLPLVVVPHGPGRARARTASRGAGPSERCRTSNSSGCFLFHYSERLRNVRVSCSLRLHPHTWCSRFEPLTGLTKIPYHSSTGVAQKLWCIFVYGTPRSTAFPNASTPQRRVLGPSWAWAVKTTRSRFPTSQPASRSGMAWCAPPLGRRSVISRWLENIPEETSAFPMRRRG